MPEFELSSLPSKMASNIEDVTNAINERFKNDIILTIKFYKERTLIPAEELINDSIVIQGDYPVVSNFFNSIRKHYPNLIWVDFKSADNLGQRWSVLSEGSV